MQRVLMNIQIEVEGKRRIINTGLKVYGTAADLTEIRDAITKALNTGLVQGWVGAGEIDDPKTVFPFNGKPIVPTTNWLE